MTTVNEPFNFQNNSYPYKHNAYGPCKKTYIHPIMLSQLEETRRVRETNLKAILKKIASTLDRDSMRETTCEKSEA